MGNNVTKHADNHYDAFWQRAPTKYFEMGEEEGLQLQLNSVTVRLNYLVIISYLQQAKALVKFGLTWNYSEKTKKLLWSSATKLL